jgi:hypothetical protein
MLLKSHAWNQNYDDENDLIINVAWYQFTREENAWRSAKDSFSFVNNFRCIVQSNFTLLVLKFVYCYSTCQIFLRYFEYTIYKNMEEFVEQIVTFSFNTKSSLAFPFNNVYTLYTVVHLSTEGAE